MAIKFSKGFKKECEKAFQQVQSHFWGDRGNAGKSFRRGKNKPETKQEK